MLVPRFFYLDGVWVPGGMVAMVVPGLGPDDEGMHGSLLHDFPVEIREENRLMWLKHTAEDAVRLGQVLYMYSDSDGTIGALVKRRSNSPRTPSRP